jgi:hypothetical protein
LLLLDPIGVLNPPCGFVERGLRGVVAVNGLPGLVLLKSPGKLAAGDGYFGWFALYVVPVDTGGRVFG